MARTLAGMRVAAGRGEGPVWGDEISFVRAGLPVRLGLSLDHDSPRPFPDAPRPCWHLSISQYPEGGRAEAAAEVEVIGWVIAGWPDAREVAIYTMATGAARHAEVPYSRAGAAS